MEGLNLKEKFVGVGPTTLFLEGECSILFAGKGSGVKIIGTGCTISEVSKLTAWVELRRCSKATIDALERFFLYRKPKYYLVYQDGVKQSERIYIEVGKSRLVVVCDPASLAWIKQLEKEKENAEQVRGWDS